MTRKLDEEEREHLYQLIDACIGIDPNSFSNTDLPEYTAIADYVEKLIGGKMESVERRLTKLAKLVRERHPENTISVSTNVWDWHGGRGVDKPCIQVYADMTTISYETFEEAFAAYERDDILFRKFK